MAVQVMDLVTGVYVPGIYWVARAAAANQNVSYSFSSTVLASALVAGHTYAAYWSTGSGTCTARNDVTPMNFTAKEYV
jgi:phage portal protein BeeE